MTVIRIFLLQLLLLTLAFSGGSTFADRRLLNASCVNCHGGEQAKGNFRLEALGDRPDSSTIESWIHSLDYVEAGEMPPTDAVSMTDTDRERLVDYLKEQIQQFESSQALSLQTKPRRLNNRELTNSLAVALQIEDVGTHEPLAMLLGDTLKDGFDTNGEALSFSEYHLDQFVTAIRKVVDATILTGDRPETQTYDVPTSLLLMSEESNRPRAEQANRTADSIDFLDPRKHVYFSNLRKVPATGRYRIRLKAACVDRHVYDPTETGIHEDDPIIVRIHLGDRKRDFALSTGEPQDIELDEWLAEGTEIRISYLTDGLKFRGNGNFKFQYSIAHDHIQQHRPKEYQLAVKRIKNGSGRRRTSVSHWSNWTRKWQGARPRLFNATVEGPTYSQWPSLRQQALLGANPKLENTAEILLPIAERAWRRTVSVRELDPIVQLVQQQKRSGTVAALKEGIVAILVSPSFLLVNPEAGTAADRFATKLNLMIHSQIPSPEFRSRVASSQLAQRSAVRQYLKNQIQHGDSAAILKHFPFAWLQLDRIHFMSPDPERYPYYDRKDISEDMVQEVQQLFQYVVQNNRPIPELLTGDYSFLNADLAAVYGIADVPPDSTFRKYDFTDGRRGGFLGSGAFLTLTADSLSTSPIHRAVYVMENFMGQHPSPPPADVPIEEPDIRSARTIREALEVHRSDESCASCHRTIDPYGFAFESFDPVGAWRDHYESDKPVRKRQQPVKGAAVDSSGDFASGQSYRDIVEYRQLMKSDGNQVRFVRCFVTKLLTYANGETPQNFTEVEKIVQESKRHEFRIVDTMAAVIHSPLFRESWPDAASNP